MKFGFILPNYGTQASRLALIDSALAAESLGFESIWLTDHLALPEADAEQFGHIYEAVTTMAYLAASTRTIRLGISTLVLPQRNPVEVAKSIATLDVLSSGRINLTTGLGWSQGEYHNLGYNFANRAKRMNEAVQVLRTLWRGQRKSSYTGKYYQFENLVFSPTPVQLGGPPLWIAGDSIHALKRAVFLADGWHPNATTPQDLQEKLSQVRPLILNRPFTIAVRMSINFSLAESHGRILGGTHVQIIEQLSSYQASGMQIAIVNLLSESQAARERAMKLFMKEIAPAFR